jgi:hypothetical protein
MRSHRGALGLGVALATLVFAVPAQAEQRYAAPGGSGAECTQEKPCLLPDAVGGAKAGDEVIVRPGTYALTSPMNAPPSATNIQIHGEPSGPMPRITAAFPGVAFAMTEAGDSLGYVEIEDDANNGAAVLCIGGRLERVRARVVGTSGVAAYAYQDCSVRNSLLRAEGGGSVALRTASGTSGNTTASARNVTAIATGSASIGAKAEYNSGIPGSITLELENSIVQGAEQDLKPEAGSKGVGNISVTHSSFDTSSPGGEAKVIDGGGNQTAPPLFVDAENGDFREAPGSPTIDAGIAGQIGPLDLAGNARVLGSAPDIGAFEFVPPAAAVPPPAAVAAGKLEALSLAPATFAAARTGEAIVSTAKKPKAPIGTTVAYSLTAKAATEFLVERKAAGRRVGGKCVKATKANRTKRSCAIFKRYKSGFTYSGAAGTNSFKFSGRIGGAALPPGSYRLVASAGGVSKTSGFTIVK